MTIRWFQIGSIPIASPIFRNMRFIGCLEINIEGKMMIGPRISKQSFNGSVNLA